MPNSCTLQIDGFWTEAGIVASHIVEVPEQAAHVTGIFDGRDRVGQVLVKGVDLSAFSKGQTLTVRGQFDDSATMAQSVGEGAFNGPTPDLLLLGGAYQTTTASDEVSLQGIAVPSLDTTRDGASQNSVRHCALNGRTDFVRNTLSPDAQEIVASFCVSATNS